MKPQPELRSPSRTIIKLLGCCVVLAVSFILLDHLLFWAVREGSARYYSSVQNDPLPWKTPYGQGDGQALILGTSRSQYGFAHYVLSKSLGLRIYKETKPGNFPQYNYYFYKKYRTKFGQPALVIYGLDYFIFEKESASLNLVRLDPSLSINKMNPRGIVNLNFPWLSRASWLFRMKPSIDKFLADLTASDKQASDQESPKRRLKRRLGLRKRRAPKPEVRIVPQRPSSWHKRPYPAAPGKEGLFFVRLLEELDREAVPTFLVILPEYIASYESNFEQDKFRADIARLAAPYKHVTIIDLDRPDKFDLENPDYFVDLGWGISNCHMLNKGARLFSRKLAAEVQEIMSVRPADRPSGRQDRN
jgi:hypothetical protein